MNFGDLYMVVNSMVLFLVLYQLDIVLNISFSCGI